MSYLSKSSINQLQTCEKVLQDIILEASLEIRIQVIEGKRALERQKQLLKDGLTKTLNSKHVTGEKPSKAVDIAPLVDGAILWDRADLFKALADVVLRIAKKKGVKIRWGGDWNMNGKTEDEKFRDLVHFELI